MCFQHQRNALAAAGDANDVDLLSLVEPGATPSQDQIRTIQNALLSRKPGAVGALDALQGFLVQENSRDTLNAHEILFPGARARTWFVFTLAALQGPTIALLFCEPHLAFVLHS